MDRLEQLRVFSKVVERGGLSRAARDLGISQPTVSKALRALEARLGTQLLLRSTRRVTVTDAGRRYYLRCRELLEGLAEAEADLGEQGALRGRLRLHGPTVLGEMYLAPIAVAFQRKHPEVVLDLTCLDSFVDLVAEGADLAIRLGELSDPSIVQRRLGTMERLLVAAPSYLRRRGTPERPVDLAGHSAIRFAGLPWGDAVSLRTGRGETTVQLQPGFVSNNAVALRHALLGGLGIGLVTRWLVDDALRRGQLVPVLPATPPPELTVSAVFPSSRFIPRRAHAFLDFLIESLRGAPGIALRPAQGRRDAGPA